MIRLSLLLLLPSVSQAFVFVEPVPDWLATESYCADEGSGVCAFQGLSNDTSSGAYDFGLLGDSEVLDTQTFEPSTQATFLWGSDAITMSHRAGFITEVPQYYLYDHPYDPLLRLFVDTDWYLIDLAPKMCLSVCITPGLDAVYPVSDSLTLTLYDGSLAPLDSVSGPISPDGITTSCLDHVAVGGPTYLEVSDPNPQPYGGGLEGFGSSGSYGLTVSHASGLYYDTYYADLDGDGFGDPASPNPNCGPPKGAWVLNNLDCDDTSAAFAPGQPEVCDNADNDCDGAIDEDLAWLTYWQDNDRDGYGDPAVSEDKCTMPTDGWSLNPSDCDPKVQAIHPFATEACDGVDNDCDGAIDEDLLVAYFLDLDQDGVGDGDPVLGCGPPGEGSWVTLDGDCDNNDPTVSPRAPELCDGRDNNCDGQVDEGLAGASYFPDLDQDGYGAGVGVTLCADPGPGWSTTDDDCDDALSSVNPGATEVCNGVDDDCLNGVDDGLPTSPWYPDSDGDGSGDAADPGSPFCDDPGQGWSVSDDDCDDADGAVHPGVYDVCNGVDDDCDGALDEDASFSGWYPDDDGDGFGAGAATDSCDDPGPGWSRSDDDCDDDDASVYPGASELPANGVDEDCDGVDSCDLDADGVMDASCGGEDCDDSDPSVPSELACPERPPQIQTWAQGGACNSSGGLAGLGGWPLILLGSLLLRRRRSA